MIYYHNTKQSSFCHGDSSDSSIYHHGILGMKWGIRRYQNEDGSLTTAGKIRYGADVAKAGIKGFGKTVGGIFKKGFKTVKNATVDTAREIKNKTKEELKKEEDNYDKQYDEARRSKRDEMLRDAKENGKFDIDFIEEIQNDYDDTNLSKEEEDREVLKRYEKYLNEPTLWRKANREYHGLSKDKTVDKVVANFKKDFGSYDQIDDPELFELAKFEQSYSLELAEQDSEEIIKLAEEKFKKG